MAGRRRDERTNDIDRSQSWSEGWVEDAPPIVRAPIVSGRVKSGRSSGASADASADDEEWKRGRHFGPGRRAAEPPRGAVSETEPAAEAEPLAATRGSEFARIGRRGILRPEVAVLLAGAAFIVAALVKPWPNPTATPALAARESALVAVQATAAPVAAPTAVPTPSPTVNIYALIPPYNYRPGQWPPPSAETAPAPDPGWASVDWSFLRRLDDHSTWGVAALTLPAQPTQKATPPDITWANEVAPWSPSEIPVPRGSSTFALAITWPSEIRVDSISFDYLSYDSPRVGVTPVPAAAVATPPLGFTAPDQPATASRLGASTNARSLDTKGSALVSGAFWIPPSGDLLAPVPLSVKAAWQASPWVWPIGSYRATLQTNAGEMIVALTLRSR